MAAETGTGDWAHYWRAPDSRLEAMHAHFERHVYHRHSHETYSLGVTDVGAQSFTCRGAAYTSAAGMVMAFNPGPDDARRVAGRARDLIGGRYRDDLTAGDLAEVTGRSLFAVHRAFSHVYGMAPSDYQRQLRLREARALIAAGTAISEAAAAAGFADQSHLSRWFVRYYGVTPGRYQRAANPAGCPR